MTFSEGTLIGKEVVANGGVYMARAYSGVLGSIALCFVISRGLVLGLLPNDILTQALVVFFGFAFIGFCIGYLAEQTVCESLENRFRDEMTNLHSVVASRGSDKSDQ
jgi:hypothetical protein